MTDFSIDDSESVVQQLDSHGIATVILNRPRVHNAFNDEMIDRLLKIINDLKNNDKVKVLILAGQGENFCSGADINWMREMVHYSEKQNYQDAKKLGDLLYHLYHFEKPTIGIAQGIIYGGANGLIACCNIVISEEHARFCFSEVKLGIIPAVISPYIIKAIGQRQTRRFFLLAEEFDAHTAKSLNLVHEIVHKAQLYEQALTLARKLLHNGPHALIACNKLINNTDFLPIDEKLTRETAEQIAKIRVSPEGQEGLSAFLDKRKPKWIEDV